MVLVFCFCLTIPSPAHAAGRYFLGSRTGWERTTETFMEGRYKNYNLFLVIGTRPTNNALKGIMNWKSPNTFTGYIKEGAVFFSEQSNESVKSVPKNSRELANSFIRLFEDPVEETKDFDLITPASILWKTGVNMAKIGWYALMTPCEPVARFTVGSLGVIASPFIKPAEYLILSTGFTCTAIYGYSSSSIGGGILLGATGAVCALDIATSPLVAAYYIFSDDGSNTDTLEKITDLKVENRQ